MVANLPLLAGGEAKRKKLCAKNLVRRITQVDSESQGMDDLRARLR